jgi:acetyl esterase/lipase
MSPLPSTLSEKARIAVTTNSSANPQANPSLPEQRAFIDNYQQSFSAIQRAKYAVDIADETIAGVPVRRISAKGGVARSKAILLNLHGGGFMVDAGSLTENIPIAALTGIPVVAVRYRLSPEHAFPAAVDDALAVYRELLKTHKASDIGLYGTSAGAVLGSELLARIRAEGMAMPAMFGMFSGDADLSRPGDTILAQKVDIDMMVRLYVQGGSQPADPMVSPMRGELKDFPPTLCLASSRDFLLSDTADFCRALEKAGVENKFVMFDGLPHAFWAYIDAPESDEAFEIMARFIKKHLEK